MIKRRYIVNLRHAFLLVSMIIMGGVCAKNTLDEPRDKPPRVTQVAIGNFALPTSQQPGPLIGFGQNILDKGEVELFAYGDYLKGHCKHFTEIVPSILYAISDRSSLFVELPIAASFKQNDTKSKGLEDLSVQLEYAVFVKNTLTTADEITLVANVGFPTGSACKLPSTGLGAPSFFLGFTASHTRTDWYFFMSSGGMLTTSYRDTKFGNQFLYQCGLSRNIWYRPDAWILNCTIELDGTYKQRNQIAGSIDRNSGSNDLLFGPSLWFSTQRLIVQGGISWVVAQHSFGIQHKDTCFVAVNVGWKW